MKKNSFKFKEMQRERIFKTKPWTKSTGAKTPKGKERSKMNTLKVSPIVNELLKQYKELFKLQRELHKTILT